MRKPAWIWLLVVGLIVVLLGIPAAPSQAWSHHGGGRVFVGVGVWPGFWWGPPAPWYWYPPPYYYPPPVIVQQPQMYIQQAPAAPTAYWYYCQSAQGYYPQVQSCPEPWVPVPPRNP